MKKLIVRSVMFVIFLTLVVGIFFTYAFELNCATDRDCMIGYVCVYGECAPLNQSPDEPCEITRSGKLVFYCEEGYGMDCRILIRGLEFSCPNKTIVLNEYK